MRSRLTPFVIAAILAAGAGPAIAADIVGVPRIVDGDTVEISGTKIRLEGIDAPETDQLCLDAKGAMGMRYGSS